jgi:hypothetical protein
LRLRRTATAFKPTRAGIKRIRKVIVADMGNASY